jgi:exonuclease SbcD
MEEDKKIAIFSDLHLGMENYGSITEDGIHSRFKDFRNTFFSFIDKVRDEDVDIVVFGGDAFKTRNPKPYQLHAFMAGLGALTREGISVIAITGNHDIYKTEGYISILKTLEFVGVQVITKPSLCFKKGVPILALPFMYDDGWLEIAKDGEDNITNIINDTIDSLLSTIKTDKKIIGVGHYGIEGAMLGGENGLITTKNMSLPRSIFRKYDNIQWFMGHYHRRQKIAKNIECIGSMDRVDFGEATEDKGFILGEYSDGDFNYDFIENNIRHMEKINIQLENSGEDEDIVEKVVNYLEEGSIYWVIINCDADDLSRAKLIKRRIEKEIFDMDLFLSRVDIESGEYEKKDFGDVKLESLEEEMDGFIKGKFSNRYDRLKNKHNDLVSEVGEE